MICNYIILYKINYNYRYYNQSNQYNELRQYHRAVRKAQFNKFTRYYSHGKYN